MAQLIKLLLLVLAAAPLLAHAQSCAGLPPFVVTNSRGWNASCANTASGGQCQALCNTGYTSVPIATSQCLAGVWQPVTGSCTQVCRGSPPAALLPAGVTWPASCADSIIIGGICTASCAPGYGAPQITCGGASGWDSGSFYGKCSATPVCRGIPTAVATNGKFTATNCADTPAGSVCAAICNTGYTGPRSPATVACLADITSPTGGSWDTTVNGACDVAACNPATQTFSIGLWGDLPYNDIQALVGVPNLIADMNKRNLAFTVHNGDWKAGNQVAGSVTPTTCSNALYAQAMGYLNNLTAPAMYTPGDNEWTDCDRPSNGGFNSRERLDYIRSYFFNNSVSFGQTKLKQEVQTDALCLSYTNQNVSCLENRRWSYNGVMFATMNVVGSCNNLCDTAPDSAEWAARNYANIVWMQSTFAAAKARNSSGIMFITQADPGFDKSGVISPVRDPKTLVETDADPDGFFQYLTTLRNEILAFNKPVAYVHGDSHYERIDKPFLTSTGARMVQFTRVETPGNNAAQGNNDVNWLQVRVDPCSKEVFSYAFINSPGNNPTQGSRRRMA